MKKHWGRSGGFTLVELLMVILIISILVAFLLPAIMGAVRRGRETAVSAEINTLTQALASFRDKFGCYPPSRIILSENGGYAGVPGKLGSRSVTALRQMWPRMTLSTSGPPVFPTGSSVWYDYNNDGFMQPAPYTITGDECLVLFLGGVPVTTTSGHSVGGFGKNPANPFLPNNANRSKGFYDFKADRLMDVDGDGLWEYGDGFSDHPFAYFSTNNGAGYDPDDVNYGEVDDNGTAMVGAFESPGAATPNNVLSNPRLTASPSPNPYTSGLPIAVTTTGSFNPSGRAAMTWWKPDSFQIISAGADGLFGIGGDFTRGDLNYAPQANQDVTGLTIYNRTPEKDNLTNLASGRLSP